MNTVLRMSVIALLIGVLSTAALLSFISLGLANPFPWLLVAVVIAVPWLATRLERQRFVTWKDEYSVGIETIDEDHRKLLNLINQLQTAVHYNYGPSFERKALDELIDYTKYHFSREEKFMRECQYPDYAGHKAEHEKMIEKLNDLLSEYDRRGPAGIEQIAHFLRDWLIHHINGSDQEYAPCLREKGMS